ncbi:MAG: hypothetical protein ACJ79A_03020 [Gemmatimonadaceae bacterium]
MLRTLLASAVLLTCAMPAPAQTTYTSTRDTLRYRETTKMQMTLTMPQGEMPMSMEQTATLSLVRLPGDSARAWFDSLAISGKGPQGELRPATDSALKRTFSLGLDARGRVKNVRAPQWPASLQGVTDLSHQFDDFFLRLPSQPLKVGLAWSDTTALSDSTGDRYSRWLRAADYRVLRDTTVDATPALVIGMKQKLGVTISAPVPGQQMRSDAQLSGEEDGYFVFAPKTGRLIARRREGKLEGPVKASGAMGEMQMNQSIAYTSTMDAVK